MKIILSILLLFMTNPLLASELQQDKTYPLQPTTSENIINSFFSSLRGTWDGLAVETPVGQVEYPITFHICDNAAVAGVAELRVSNHHWKFWRSNNELRLTFMSTFRGNRQPTLLVLTKAENNTYQFNAPELALLTLSISLHLPNIDIRIYHHLKPHVYIRLTRSEKQFNESESASNRNISCRAIPPH